LTTCLTDLLRSSIPAVYEDTTKAYCSKVVNLLPFQKSQPHMLLSIALMQMRYVELRWSVALCSRRNWLHPRFTMRR